jgi:hypothetical protein
MYCSYDPLRSPTQIIPRHSFILIWGSVAGSFWLMGSVAGMHNLWLSLQK